MAWTREEAIEWGRKGARKGGLARAARLSATRRLDIAMLANAARWRSGFSELQRIDRELDKLSVIAACALKNGDLNLCQKAIQAKLSGIRQRISTRRLLEREEREHEQRRRAAKRVWLLWRALRSCKTVRGKELSMLWASSGQWTP
jgi:hypothetical protein